ncbi:hypothetical protein M9458_036854, partial [Cirrhinus mrigala]
EVEMSATASEGESEGEADGPEVHEELPASIPAPLPSPPSTAGQPGVIVQSRCIYARGALPPGGISRISLPGRLSFRTLSREGLTTPLDRLPLPCTPWQPCKSTKLRRAMQELRVATGFALRATKVMSTVVVQERHLWLTLAQMADVDKARFLDAPISQGGLFGHTFSAVQKQTEAIKHILPHRDSATTSPGPQPPPARRRGRPPAASKKPAAEVHDARLAARRRAGRGRAAPPAPQGPATNTRRRSAK